MNGFELHVNGASAPVIIEECAVNGMELMTSIFADDIETVTDVKPRICKAIPDDAESVIIVATCGSSTLLDSLEAAGEISLEKVRNKREVYGIFILESALLSRKVLLIAGSDKRGTIYGMFRISEMIGVSPFVYWADAVPQKKSEIVIGMDAQQISSEPSVKYRGFFINDEQPCFGNWAREKFGSNKPDAELYRHIFELLLRLKGNYLWPAMWRSDFTYDSIENAALADRMGVIIGASHHEPCCRSGGEFQKLRHSNPQYGKEWSFLSNPDGISEFWKDGLIRNSSFESLITIGMRGENDSYLMPENATLEDNINVLKSAITEQKKLIKEYADATHPQLLAIYKEVEDYYQGDEVTKGLKDWDVLDNDIMMLCDDNFGNVRTLPSAEQRKHPGGFGMYYHFDYYGAPVSYLWIDTTPIEKICEQMGMAYDYGVREAWIVNVGDIKNQELPLSYFLDLAYDFDKWGDNNSDTAIRYTRQWLDKLGFTDKAYEKLEYTVDEYVKLNGTCRPEVLKSTTYHPVHYNEAQRVLMRTEKIMQSVENAWSHAKDTPLSDCFFETVYYPVMASANIIRMNIYAGMNNHYTKQRKKTGERYAALVCECIQRDRELTKLYHGIGNGRWNHMQSVFHIGYIGWNDEEWQYPDCHILHPVPYPRLIVSVDGTEQVTGGNPWRRHKLTLNFTSPFAVNGGFEVANGGEGSLDYRIEWDNDVLSITPADTSDAVACGEHTVSGSTADAARFIVTVRADKLARDGMDAHIRVYGDNCEETAEVSSNGSQETRADIRVIIRTADVSGLNNGVFIENNGCICAEAVHYTDKRDTETAAWKVLDGYGKTCGGIKVFPTTAVFNAGDDAPSVEYDVFSLDGGEYELMLYASPSNPVVYKGRMRIGVKINGGETILLNTIPDEDYTPWLSRSWARGVLEQVHITSAEVTLNKGVNRITLVAADPAVVIEKLELVGKHTKQMKSYLGAAESFRA